MSQSTKPVEGKLHLKARSALCAIEKKRTGNFKGKISIINDCPLDNAVGHGI